MLRQAADEMLDWLGSGMSVMEMSHRGKEFIAIHADAEARLRRLLDVPENYKVLFMQGGAIGENAIVPMNMLRGKAGADYIDTGEWSRKSIKEARKYGRVNVAASAAAGGYTGIPPRESWALDPDAAYVHISANETIGGVEYHFTPDVGEVPLVADVSSNILSRPMFKSEVHYGGPVSTDTIHYIHNLGNLLEDSVEVSRGVYWGGDLEKLKFLIQSELIKPHNIRFFVGYSGWSPGQLSEEMGYGSWVVADMHANYIFKSHPSRLWKQVMANKGKNFEIIAQMPDNINYN